MALIIREEIPDPANAFVRDSVAAERTNWRGRECLRLSGETAALALLPEVSLSRGSIEVDIGAEGVAYPGIVFRAADSLNYELAYVQPHTSTKWDAIQYDPVFHGTNTWQLYHGACYQKAAAVPTGEWFTFGVEFAGRRARIRVGDQPPLLVDRLAHRMEAGRIGLWTYKPGFFRNLRVRDDPPDFPAESPDVEPPAPGTISEWFLEGYGAVAAEPGGAVNLSRYLPVSVREARLMGGSEWRKRPTSPCGSASATKSTCRWTAKASSPGRISGMISRNGRTADTSGWIIPSGSAFHAERTN